MTDCKCRLLDPHLKGSAYFYLTVSTDVLWNGLQTSSPSRDIWGKKMPFYCWVKARCSVSVGSRDQLAGNRKKTAFSGVIFVDIIVISEVNSVNIRHQWITKSYWAITVCVLLQTGWGALSSPLTPPNSASKTITMTHSVSEGPNTEKPWGKRRCGWDAGVPCLSILLVACGPERVWHSPSAS